MHIYKRIGRIGHTLVWISAGIEEGGEAARGGIFNSRLKRTNRIWTYTIEILLIIRGPSGHGLCVIRLHYFFKLILR